MSAKLGNVESSVANGSQRQARLTVGLENLEVRVSQMQTKLDQIEKMFHSVEGLKENIRELIKAIVARSTTE